MAIICFQSFDDDAHSTVSTIAPHMAAPPTIRTTPLPKKQSLPANMDSYVRTAMGAAESFGGTAQLRKISVIKSPSTAAAPDLGSAEGRGQLQSKLQQLNQQPGGGGGGGMLGKKKKRKGSEQNNKLVFSFTVRKLLAVS